MKLKIDKNNLLKYLLIIVFISTSISFGIKFLGVTGKIPWTIAYNDIGPWADASFQPGFPYLEKNIEYPVIIGMIMYIASRSSPMSYLWIHYFIFLAAALITTYYLYKLSLKLNTEKTSLFIFWAFAPSLMWFAYYNWDIIAVMFSMMALYYYKERKDILATVFLSLGFATKMYPILFLFPLLLHRRFKDWIKLGTTFILTFITVNIFFIIKNMEGWKYIYAFHDVRNPNIDSIWHLIQQLIPNLTIPQINNLTLIIFVASYLFIMFKFRKKDYVFLSFIASLLFLITNKVFSPQFTLWLLPFFALYGSKMFYGLEFSNLGVLFTTLPAIFLGHGIVWSGFFVVIRHITLLYILIEKLRSKQG